MEIRFPLILDGATGTELQKHGYAGDVSAEQWTLAHPDVIVDIQRGYVCNALFHGLAHLILAEVRPVKRKKSARCRACAKLKSEFTSEFCTPGGYFCEF